eukprot:14099367-Heterocapsa_arctica.AAC.1
MGKHRKLGGQALVPHERGVRVHSGARLPHRHRAQLACGHGAGLQNVDPEAAGDRGDGQSD